MLPPMSTAPPQLPVLCALALSLAALSATGCTDLSDYATPPGRAYQGTIVGTEADGACPPGTPCSFIRRGFPAGVELSMTFDPVEASSDPGTLTTTGELCGATFDDTPLLPITPLAHDALSLYDFPGGGRLRNYMFVARPSAGPLAGRDAMVFVSLLQGGGVDVRILAGPGHTDCAPDDCAAFAAGTCDFFGVFPTTKGD